MSKRSIDKQIYEQYVDATVALFMEHYAVALGDATMQTKAPELSCSETLDLRCMTAIRKECAKLRRKEAWKSTKRVLRSAAVLLIALLSLSSVLFMTVEAFRVPVINFFIEEGTASGQSPARTMMILLTLRPRMDSTPTTLSPDYSLRGMS